MTCARKTGDPGSLRSFEQSTALLCPGTATIDLICVPQLMSADGPPPAHCGDGDEGGVDRAERHARSAAVMVTRSNSPAATFPVMQPSRSGIRFAGQESATRRMGGKSRCGWCFAGSATMAFDPG